MDTTYHLIARMMVRFFDDEVDVVSQYRFGKIDWLGEIPDLIEFITEEYAVDRYDEKGYSLISTPSIIKHINHKKLLEYIENIEYEICITKLFDYNDSDDFFDENEKFLKDKHDAMWDAYP